MKQSRGASNMCMAREQKTYAASWEGELILACRKCQKKLKRSHTSHALAKLKKAVKRHNKEDSDQMLHVINVPCMDLCPKDGVTICCPVRDSTRLVIVRTEEDVHRLYREQKGPRCSDEHNPGPREGLGVVGVGAV